MTKNELRQKIGIKDIYRNDDYTFVYLDNEQKLLVKDEKIYDISCYSSFHKVNLKNKTKFILGKNLKKDRLPLTPIKIKI